MNKLYTLIIIIIFQSQAIAQVDTVALQSIEGITDKMLELISGPVGEERQWDEFRNLFLPTAQFTVMVNGRDGGKRARVMNLEQFVRDIGPAYARDGFEEYSLGLTVNEFNGIATAFQSYYCKNLIGTYEKRGINTYHLVHMNNRWWIASTMFTDESDDAPLPEKYLEENRR